MSAAPTEAKGPVEPTRVQLDLLRMIPTDGGITTRDVWNTATAKGLPTGVNSKGQLTVCGFPLISTLRHMRRVGWLIHQRHADPPVWSRTPTGTDTARRGTTRMTATPRQEATT